MFEREVGRRVQRASWVTAGEIGGGEPRPANLLLDYLEQIRRRAVAAKQQT